MTFRLPSSVCKQRSQPGKLTESRAKVLSATREKTVPQPEGPEILTLMLSNADVDDHIRPCLDSLAADAVVVTCDAWNRLRTPDQGMGYTSVAHEKLVVGDGALAGRGDELGKLGQGAAGVAWGRRPPRGPPTRQFGIFDVELQQ